MSVSTSLLAAPGADRSCDGVPLASPPVCEVSGSLDVAVGGPLVVSKCPSLLS